MPKRLAELAPADVEDIYGLWKFGYKQVEIAQAYGVSTGTVSTIINRRRYQDLQVEMDQEAIDQFSIDVTGSRSLGVL